ncbi:MAG: alpha-1,2-fucosyltransferase [Taibaiella sp.]|nr:alpha-1,2-fucosyltransferase [Taibaiella sp.]
MIGSRLWAGLGNQLFQYAAVIGAAKKYNRAYWFPTKTLDPRVWKTYFTDLPKQPFDIGHYKIYKELTHSYTPIPDQDNIILEGFWQSEKYFEGALDDIRYAFNFPWKPLTDFVSIHVRRGDYLLYPGKHPVVTIEYLTQAVHYFIDKGYKSFVVTSDDISWCRKNLDFLKINGIDFSYSARKTEIEDLALGSCCAHQVGSNSTFSLWQYFLNHNPDKEIVLPKVWFGPGNAHLVTEDIYPEKAIII